MKRRPLPRLRRQVRRMRAHMRSTTAARLLGAHALPPLARLHLLVLDTRLQAGHRRFGSTLRPRRDQVVRLREGSVWLARSSLEVDYWTIWEIFVDEIFAAPYRDVAAIDGGGHRGYYATYAFAQGAASVYSFEPHSDNFRTLERAASTMRHRRWVLHRAALGPTGGWGDVAVSSESWSHSLREPASGEVVGTERVPVLAFPEVLKAVMEQEQGRPLAVKLNIERMAGAVIMATPPSVWEHVTEVMFDYEPGTPEALHQILGHLEAGGFDLVHSDGRNYRLSRRRP